MLHHSSNLEGRFCGRHSTLWTWSVDFVAGAVHRASRSSCGARGRRWAAAAVCVAGAALHGEPGKEISWQAQPSVHLERRFRGKRSAQSLPEQLRRAWSPLGRGCRVCRRRSTSW